VPDAPAEAAVARAPPARATVAEVAATAAIDENLCVMSSSRSVSKVQWGKLANR
jgi:hypothetical protein